MSNIQVEIREYTLPEGTQAASFPLEVAGLTSTSSGWVWYRSKPTWIEPRVLHSYDALLDLSVHLMCIRGDEYMCILPVSSSTALCHLRRDNLCPAGLAVSVRSATISEQARAAVVIVRSPDPAKAAALPSVAVSHARQWLDSGKLVYNPMAHGVFDGLGFCTWAALGGNPPTEKRLRKLVEDLVGSRIPIQAFLIDDGWQNHRTYFDKTGEDIVRRKGLWDFNAHPDVGPGGLAAAVEMIKSRFAGLPTGGTEVGVWLSLTGGSWEGIHPDSPLISKFNCRPYTATGEWWNLGNPPPPGQTYLLPPPETSLAFWKRYFLSLSEAGITFVKVDNQAAVNALVGVDGAIEARELWRGMHNAANEVFGPNRVMHCMAHSESTWAGEQGLGLASNGDRFVWRNSDDFGCDGKRANQDHIFWNILNALTSNSLCVIPDADMFMTASNNPPFHALLRALFPGPLMLSDPPGQHDPILLWRLIAPDRTGIIRVLKASTAPEPLPRRMLDTSICDDADGTALWAAVRTPHATLVGVWNVRGEGYNVRDRITVDDVEDALGHVLDQHAVVRINIDDIGLHSASMLRPEQHGELGRIDLPPNGATAFWIAPMFSIGAGPIAVLGLVDAYAGPVAIGNVEHTINRVDIVMKFSGVLGLLVAAPLRPAATALVDGRPESVRYSRLPRLDGRQQNMFLLRIKVGSAGSVSEATETEGWMVRVSIE